MIFLASIPITLGVAWWLWRRARKSSALPPGPLAGYDTGVRSVWRTPGAKRWGPRRGF